MFSGHGRLDAVRASNTSWSHTGAADFLWLLRTKNVVQPSDGTNK